ncbi:MAG: response regulator transcription factor, partial [Lachnospiraceae bacterium]|nr:response regulator transcription factor [Lachnospiraceae bacterium]
MARILIVEDDRAISGLMVKTLTVNGHQCLTAFRGSEAVSISEKQSVDLVLLDINLPDTDGFSLAKKLKGIPIIYVTARGEISDRIRGLDSGGEDYIVKPFHIQELISRVHVVLRRYHREDIFCLGKVKVDLQNEKVFLDEEEIVLTKREFELLKMLILNKNITLT